MRTTGLNERTFYAEQMQFKYKKAIPNTFLVITPMNYHIKARDLYKTHVAPYATKNTTLENTTPRYAAVQLSGKWRVP